MDNITLEPSKIFDEYQKGINFKNSIGDRGLFEQNKVNERFYSGDQWHGAKCGNDRPLVRYNVIKRIGDYKIATIGAAPVAVNYSAEGVPNTLELREQSKKIKSTESAQKINEYFNQNTPSAEEINLVMSALCDYQKVTSERLKFDMIRTDALRNAYIDGEGIIYTYWNGDIKTGLYADYSRTKPIMGDIECEVLDIENVYFGDPNLDDVQKQPFIIIAQRKSVGELKAEALRNGVSKEEINSILPDRDTGYMAGERSRLEPDDSQKATVLTKFWKERSIDGNDFIVKACRVTKSAVIRPEWNIGVRLYPLAKFSWDKRKNCAYGESEVTHLIPNQIAINRMVTASVWAVMTMGMPIMLVNGDIVQEPITNDPGQIVTVNGSDSLERSIRYIQPPNITTNFNSNISSLIAQTLSQSGATEAALGDVSPDNTSAIIAVREAATLPLQTMQNRYYQFCEDVARIWAEYWIMQYGKRSLKIEDEKGVWYMPFDGERYKDFIISVKVDIGASTLWSEAQSVKTLDNLFEKQVIDSVQYLQRLPKGVVPDVTGLINQLKSANNAVASAQKNPQSQFSEECETDNEVPENQSCRLAENRGADELSAENQGLADNQSNKMIAENQPRQADKSNQPIAENQAILKNQSSKANQFDKSNQADKSNNPTAENKAILKNKPDYSDKILNEILSQLSGEKQFKFQNNKGGREH